MKKYIIFLLAIFFLTLVIPTSKKSEVDVTKFSTTELDTSVTPTPADPIDLTHIHNVGRGVYALYDPKFDCEDFIKSLKNVKNISLATLFKTFGNDFKCAQKLLQDPRTRNFEVALINESCSRSHRCGKYEFLAGNLTSIPRYSNLLQQNNAKLRKKFDKFVAPLQELLAGYLQPETECQISPGLESNVTNIHAIRHLLQWVREDFPQCKVVWNPLTIPKAKVIALIGADYIEGHGNVPPVSAPCIVNNDGTILAGNQFQSFINSYQYCKVVNIWGLVDNCGGTGSPGSFTDPRARSCDPGSMNHELSSEIVEAEKRPNPNQAPPSAVWTDKENLSLVGCVKFKKVCDEVGSAHNSGDGFLLKQSDISGRGAVILLPPTDKGISSIRMVHNGKVIDNFTQDGIFLEDGFKNREIWRSSIPSYEYPIHVVLKENNGAICRIVQDPRQRVEDCKK